MDQPAPAPAIIPLSYHPSLPLMLTQIFIIFCIQIGAGEQIAIDALKQQDELAQAKASAGQARALLLEKIEGQDFTIRELQADIQRLTKQNESEALAGAELRR